MTFAIFLIFSDDLNFPRFSGSPDGLIDWLIDWGLTSHQKHFIGHIGDGLLRIKWPNQQCQSTEGTHKTKLNQIQQNIKIHLN